MRHGGRDSRKPEVAALIARRHYACESESRFATARAFGSFTSAGRPSRKHGGERGPALGRPWSPWSGRYPASCAGRADPEAHLNLILTVGHSTRTFKELLSLLRAHGVCRLVDVRRFPHSPRHPHFDGEALSERLCREGAIRYSHLLGLGVADPRVRIRRTLAGTTPPSAAMPTTWQLPSSGPTSSGWLGSAKVRSGCV